MKNNGWVIQSTMKNYQENIITNLDQQQLEAIQSLDQWLQSSMREFEQFEQQLEALEQQSISICQTDQSQVYPSLSD